MEALNGSCGCGALQYKVEGELLNSVFCYCKECQKHTGSDKWFGAWYPQDKFNIVKGTPSVYTRKGDSGQDMNHLFCTDCGVTLCAEVSVGNFYSVAVSTLDNALNIQPAMCIYTASAPNWAVFPNDIPKFEILPPGLGD